MKSAARAGCMFKFDSEPLPGSSASFSPNTAVRCIRAISLVARCRWRILNPCSAKGKLADSQFGRLHDKLNPAHAIPGIGVQAEREFDARGQGLGAAKPDAVDRLALMP